ncbi:HAD family phosphatase [bacterium]|nr:MAG: HAD family phosphatase [bacterium]
MNIKAIIFDYGQVLTFNQSVKSINSMIGLLNSNENHFNKAYYEHRDLYDSGKINGPEYWKLIIKSLALEINDQETINTLVNHDLESWFEQNQEMWDLVLKLKNNYKTALLSNNIHELVEKIEKELDLNKYFDTIVFSNRLDFIKPDLRIYQYCLDLMQIKAEEAIFIDDKQINVDAANKLGIHGITFTSYEQLINDLEKMNILIV